MKYNRITLILIFIVVGSAVVAQPRLREPEAYIGTHVGAMASTMIFKPSISGIELQNVLISPNGGLVFRYAGHKVCAIQVEINYMQRGWNECLNDINYTRQLEYIEIPLLMHLYFGGQHLRFFFNLGPQIGYCFRDVATGTPNPHYKHQYENIQKHFDWGLAGGLGVYYRHKKVGLFQIEARCNYSFGSIFNNRKTDYFELSNPINVSLNFAYMWQIKIK